MDTRKKVLRRLGRMRNVNLSSGAGKGIHKGRTGCYPVQDRERITLLNFESALEEVALASGVRATASWWLSLYPKDTPESYTSHICRSLVVKSGYLGSIPSDVIFKIRFYNKLTHRCIEDVVKEENFVPPRRGFRKHWQRIFGIVQSESEEVVGTVSV